MRVKLGLERNDLGFVFKTPAVVKLKPYLRRQTTLFVHSRQLIINLHTNRQYGTKNFDTTKTEYINTSGILTARHIDIRCNK